MASSTSESLTERESQIMDVIWRMGEATAEQVREAAAGVARTTRRSGPSCGCWRRRATCTHEARGKAYVYRAAVGRQKAQRLALRSVLTRFFAGSAEDLVLRLIEDEHLSPSQLDDLRRSADSAGPPRRREKGESS